MSTPISRRLVLPLGLALLGLATAADQASPLDPAKGAEIGQVYEAWLSPWQEPDEEQNTPKGVPKVFQSTAPSLTRAEREAAGHRGAARVRFTKDLSRAFVDVKIEGIKAEDINMFHIHCGRPGVLGPILVDLADLTDLKKDLADGQLSVEVTSLAITQNTAHAHDAVGAFTRGCVIPSPSLQAGLPPKVSTVAGMATVAAEGELYFNLHTVSQTYYGDIRGQILPADNQ